MTKEEFLTQLAKALDSSKPLTLDTMKTEVSGWDSMGTIAIMALLQEQFGVNLDMEELVELKGVRDLIAVLTARNIQLD